MEQFPYHKKIIFERTDLLVQKIKDILREENQKHGVKDMKQCVKEMLDVSTRHKSETMQINFIRKGKIFTQHFDSPTTWLPFIVAFQIYGTKTLDFALHGQASVNQNIHASGTIKERGGYCMGPGKCFFSFKHGFNPMFDQISSVVRMKMPNKRNDKTKERKQGFSKKHRRRKQKEIHLDLHMIQEAYTSFDI